jgi:hypothetical protein
MRISRFERAQLQRLLKKSEKQTCRRLKPTPTYKNKRLERGPEGPHYPNVAFFRSLWSRVLSKLPMNNSKEAVEHYLSRKRDSASFR